MKRYPAQIRYEKKHPTISFRLDIELKKRLKKVLEGKSFADFVKEGLGVRERETKSLKNEYNKGYKKGYETGYGYAKLEYGTYIPCAICGRMMLINEEREKKEIEKYFRDRELCHKMCIEREEEEERIRNEGY